jgi:hypothetical protein
VEGVRGGGALLKLVVREERERGDVNGVITWVV